MVLLENGMGVALMKRDRSSSYLLRLCPHSAKCGVDELTAFGSSTSKLIANHKRFNRFSGTDSGAAGAKEGYDAIVGGCCEATERWLSARARWSEPVSRRTREMVASMKGQGREKLENRGRTGRIVVNARAGFWEGAAAKEVDAPSGANVVADAARVRGAGGFRSG